MNPWAGLILLVGIAMMIMAIRGTQDNLIAAIKGKPYGNSQLA